MDDEYILNYLDKNYKIELKYHDFIIIDKIAVQNNYTYGYDSFVETFNKILPSSNTETIVYKWYNTFCDKLNLEIINHVEDLGYKIGISRLIESTLKKYQISGKPIDGYVYVKVSQLYRINYVEPKLKRFQKKINESKDIAFWCEKFLKRFPYKNKRFILDITDAITKYYKDNILLPKLTSFLEKANLNQGSLMLEIKLKIVMGSDIDLFGDIIYKVFDSFYQNNHLTKILDDYVDTLENLNSISIINNFYQLKLENETHSKYCLDKLNAWYQEHELDKKMEEILKEFIITLGPTNWEVRWIGHGLIDENKLFKKLREHEYHQSYINKIYTKWYSDAVIEACERNIMKDTYNQNE